MKCLWCNFETTKKRELATKTIKYANLEHIFPECVGGKKTLEQGKVCEDCNNRLSKIDENLKRQNFMMMKQYQDSSEILIKSGVQKRPVGKKGRDKKDKERKKSEILEILGYSGGTTVKRISGNTSHIRLTGLQDGTAGDITYNSKFSKALHKCAINVLLDEQGYDYLKKNHKDLIGFVNNPENRSYNEWSYAICYADIFSKIHFEPFCLQKIEIENITHAVVLIFPCAIFIVCTKPNTVHVDLLNIIGSNPPKLENWERSGFDYLKHFDSKMISSRKTYGDKLKFTLIKNEIGGKINPKDSFYLLTKCNTCGQTNPTGIMLDKNIILSGDQNHYTSGNRNSWNKLSADDLEKKGLEIEKLNEKSLQKLINQEINYPMENDIKKMNIKQCHYQCLNCGEWNTYDASDCFV